MMGRRKGASIKRGEKDMEKKEGALGREKEGRIAKYEYKPILEMYTHILYIKKKP